MSFNLAPDRLVQWPAWLQDAYNLTVVYPNAAGLDGEAFFRDEIVEQPLGRMQQHRMPFLDALILNLIERITGVDVLITWNARHYRGKTSVSVMTPAEYLGLAPATETS